MGNSQKEQRGKSKADTAGAKMCRYWKSGRLGPKWQDAESGQLFENGGRDEKRLGHEKRRS